jgi:hypothetical protein
MAPNQKLKRRNHTVNRSYLKRFANGDGYLSRVDLPGDKRILISLDDATVIKDFYVVTLPDGSKTDKAEDVFCVVESAAAAAIRAVVDEFVWPIPAKMRRDIAAWVALQYLRSPSVRRLGREIAEGLTEVGLPVPAGTGRQITMKLPADQVEGLAGPGLQLALIRRQLLSAAEMLHQREWVITDYRRKRLATSDTPVVLFPAAQGVGIANAAAVYVPIDRRAGLIMTAPGRGERRVFGTARSALIANQAMAQNARKYLFHHPDDDPLSGVELPQPRGRELANPADAAKLVEDLFR